MTKKSKSKPEFIDPKDPFIQELETEDSRTFWTRLLLAEPKADQPAKGAKT